MVLVLANDMPLLMRHCCHFGIAMSGGREEPAEQQQRVLNIVSTAVSVVAAVFLGGGESVN
jgi:hypothetical protein